MSLRPRLLLPLALTVICLTSAAGAAGSGDDDPGFGDLIRRSSYLRSVVERDPGQEEEQQAPPETAERETDRQQQPSTQGDAQLTEVVAAIKAGKFQQAATTLRRLVETSPRRAKLRYYLAYTYYAASKLELDRERQNRMIEISREETYRALNLIGDNSDPENSVWVAHAEGLFDRVSPAPIRNIPPVHGRIVQAFDGDGGVLIGSAVDSQGKRTYDLANKPVGSFGQGTVISAHRSREFGVVVQIRYTDARGRPFVAEYGNLKDSHTLVTGATVEPNTIIGHVAPGQGGAEATLYLEIRRQDRFFDPARLFTGTDRTGDTF